MAADSAIEIAGRLGLTDPVRWLATAGGLVRWGPSLASLYRAAAFRYPTRPAVVDHRGALSFARLDRRSSASARGLHALGLDRGEDLGLLCRNHRDAVEMGLAAAKAGVGVVHLNPNFGSAQLGDVLRREGVGCVVVDADLVDLVPASGFDGPVYMADALPDDDRGPGLARLPDLRRAGLRRPVLLPPLPTAPVLLTSGTTGTPKGARRRRLPSGLRAAMGVASRIPYRNDDRFLIASPLFHAWGLSQLVTAASLGATVILRTSFAPADTVRTVIRERATVLVAVPIMLQRILTLVENGAVGRETDDDDPSTMTGLRIVASSGSALPAGLATAWMDRIGDNLYNLYGSTEVGQATIAGPEDLRAEPTTAGWVVPGTRVEILDGDGAPAPVGEVGRIFVGGGSGFAGYTGGGSKESVDGMLSTGDLGRFDQQGRLFVNGRSDDMIVSGGENVFPAEVEDVLALHPGVAEVAVIGVPDDEFGQRLAAFVVSAAGHGRPMATALRAEVAAKLARYKVPRDITFVDELPRTETGKVLRRCLGPT